MRRNLPQPLDSRILHAWVRFEALGDGAGNEGSALLLEQFDHPLLLRHQRIDPRRLPVEEGGDGVLLGLSGHEQGHPLQVFELHRLSNATAEAVEDLGHVVGVKQRGGVFGQKLWPNAE